MEQAWIRFDDRASPSNLGGGWGKGQQAGQQFQLYQLFGGNILPSQEIIRMLNRKWTQWGGGGVTVPSANACFRYNIKLLKK